MIDIAGRRVLYRAAELGRNQIAMRQAATQKLNSYIPVGFCFA
jgi:hypothetical protein